ncbi:MAG: flagellin lysine-N-methylase [bacterium]
MKNQYIIPDYYAGFTCKGASCRNCCCSGWSVTIPRTEYYTLLGMSCDKKTRERIDRAFLPVFSPSPDRYAEINHNHLGECPLRMENGYCLLQYRCGEKVLPWVCRYYPRAPRTDHAFECSCSNSCEKTLEMLFALDDKLAFETRELAFDMPVQTPGPTDENQSFYVRIREFCFEILENRTRSLATRILMIGKLMAALDRDRNVDLSSVDLSVPQYVRDVPLTYRLLMNVAGWFTANSHSISQYCHDNDTYYRDGDLLQKYEMAQRHFDAVLPNQEILFEKMLINHLFMRQFPFQDGAETFFDAFVSLCGTYLFLRYLSLSLMLPKQTLTDFVDIMAKTFRVVAHTGFENNIKILLRNENAADFATLAVLIQA